MAQLLTLLPEHPLTPDTLFYRIIGIILNALSVIQPLIAPFGIQHFSYMPSFGILSTYAPTPCGLATFSAALAKRLAARAADVKVVRIADGEVSELRVSRFESPMLETICVALPVPLFNREPLWFAFARCWVT